MLDYVLAFCAISQFLHGFVLSRADPYLTRRCVQQYRPDSNRTSLKVGAYITACQIIIFISLLPFSTEPSIFERCLRWSPYIEPAYAPWCVLLSGALARRALAG